MLKAEIFVKYWLENDTVVRELQLVNTRVISAGANSVILNVYYKNGSADVVGLRKYNSSTGVQKTGPYIWYISRKNEPTSKGIHSFGPSEWGITLERGGSHNGKNYSRIFRWTDENNKPRMVLVGSTLEIGGSMTIKGKKGKVFTCGMYSDTTVSPTFYYWAMRELNPPGGKTC